MKVAIKYCGACNPHVDISRITKRLHTLASSQGITFVPLDSEDIGIIIILNGCLKACADREEVRSKASYSLVVAGETIEGAGVAEEAIPPSIHKALQTWLK